MNIRKIIVKSGIMGTASLGVIASALLGAGLANADEVRGEGGTPKFDEIIVTAQKRQESIQDIPLAVSAIGGSTMKRLGVQDPLTLGAAVPNLSIQTNSGVTYIYLRGVGNNYLGLGIDSNIAYHTNGVYVARPRGQVAGYFDVERIEVVRGPQGDLYGRNATGGAINIISRKPAEDLEGDATLSIGNYGLVRAEAGIGGPIVGEAVRARLAGYVVDRGGYGKNNVTGKDIDNQKEIGGRLTIDADLSEDFNVEVIADYFRADDAWGVVHQLGGGRPDIVTLAETLGSIPSNLRNVVSGIDSNRFVRVWGLQSTASWDMTEDWTLRSITAYRETRYTSRDELVGNPSQAELTQLEQQHQFSEELQVMASGSNWDFILGGYYFTEEVEGFVHIPLFFAPGGDFDQSGVGDTKAYAAFAHGSIEIVDKLSLVLGARYSHEKRASTGAFDVVFHVTPTGGEKSFNSFTPKATLQFEPNENMMVYAGVSKGSKSGGFTIGVPGPGVEPETLWSYEVGLKAEFFDRRLTTNLSAFYYDYKDLVVTRVVGAQTLNENAAAATIKGIEAEIVVRPIDNLRIDVTLGLLDPKYDSYNTPDPVRPELGILDLSGNRLAGTSNYTARIGIQYDVPLDNGAMITLDGDVFFSGDMYFSPYQQKNAYQAAYETYNASLTYQSDSFWSVTAWGRNLSNAIIISNQFVSSDFWGFPKFTYLRNPRTYGVNLQVNF